MNPRGRVVLAGVVSLLLAGPIRGQCNQTESVVLSPDGAQSFAWAIEWDGAFLVVGDPNAKGRVSGSGAVYAYRTDGVSWWVDQKVNGDNSKQYDSYGGSVALDGTVFAVGAPGADARGKSASGRAYVFRHDGSQWLQEKRMSAPDGNDGDGFGASISLSGNLLAISAPWHDAVGRYSGAVYIYEYNGNSWLYLQKLVPADAKAGDSLGWALSLDGGWLMVAAPNDSDVLSGAGSVYFWQWDGTRFVEYQEVRASDGGVGDGYGASVALEGSLAVVGAPNKDQGNSNTGGGYVLRFDGSSWIEEQALRTYLGPNAYEGLGQSAAIDNGQIALSGLGTVYLFRQNNSTWNEANSFQDSLGYGRGGAWLGKSVDLTSDTLVSGNSGREALVFDLEDLGFAVDQPAPQAGDAVTFDVCGGVEDLPAMLVVVAINGQPTWVPVRAGTFDLYGVWSTYGVAPPGLTGTSATFQAVGFYTPGRVGPSRAQTILFQ